MEHGACCIEDHRRGGIDESGGPMPWATSDPPIRPILAMDKFHPVFELLALLGSLHVYVVWSRACCDNCFVGQGIRSPVVFLNIRDFTSPAPTADSIFAEPGHSGCFAYFYDHIPDCPHFLYGSSPVQCTSQVTLELRVNLNPCVSACIKPWIVTCLAGRAHILGYQAGYHNK